MPSESAKHPRLVDLVERWRADLGAGYFVEVPWWDDDLIATGLGRPDDPDVLVYVALQLQDLQRGETALYYECEVPTTDSYEVVSQGENGSYEDVLDAIRSHLAPTIDQRN